mmetsp:Transcript_24286/g.50799  ORF Transcript_24286/g.50799 Transcript_24286/m.50799 type:complete len:122 (+) Transcript_24286:537-902(+)
MTVHSISTTLASITSPETYCRYSRDSYSSQLFPSATSAPETAQWYKARDEDWIYPEPSSTTWYAAFTAWFRNLLAFPAFAPTTAPRAFVASWCTATTAFHASKVGTAGRAGSATTDTVFAW